MKKKREEALRLPFLYRNINIVSQRGVKASAQFFKKLADSLLGRIHRHLHDRNAELLRVARLAHINRHRRNAHIHTHAPFLCFFYRDLRRNA